MIIKAKFEYKESYLPPRCRKLRYRDREVEIDIEIPETIKENAPLAFRHWDSTVPENTKEYRLYQDQLYTRVARNPSEWETDRYLVSRLNRPWVLHYTEEDGTQALMDQASLYLLIDQEVWVRSGEPCYTVHTFGLGYNHGGTALMIGNLSPDSTDLQTTAYYSALDYDRAVKKAIETATERGDDKSLGSIQDKAHGCIEVLMPEAVKLKSHIEWEIPVKWTMSDVIKVTAPTLEEAMELAPKLVSYRSGRYVPDSCEVVIP